MQHGARKYVILLVTVARQWPVANAHLLEEIIVVLTLE